LEFVNRMAKHSAKKSVVGNLTKRNIFLKPLASL